MLPLIILKTQSSNYSKISVLILLLILSEFLLNNLYNNIGVLVGNVDLRQLAF